MEKLKKIESKRMRISFSRQLKRLIEESNFGQKEIASDLGIDPSYLSRVLSGRYSFGIDIALAICHKLNGRLIFYPYF